MNLYICPLCGKPFYTAAEPEYWRDNICPNCGRDMKGENETRHE